LRFFFAKIRSVSVPEICNNHFVGPDFEDAGHTGVRETTSPPLLEAARDEVAPSLAVEDKTEYIGVKNKLLIRIM
jgi:hypothetical protein